MEDVSVTLLPPCLCPPSEGYKHAWGLLYKFGWDTFAYNAWMKDSGDLILGKAVLIAIIYCILDSWLYLLNAYYFSFECRMESQRRIVKLQCRIVKLWCCKFDVTLRNCSVEFGQQKQNGNRTSTAKVEFWRWYPWPARPISFVFSFR